MHRMVCVNCLGEAYLRDEVSANEIGDCGYCGEERPVMGLDKLVLLCNTAIRSFFRYAQQPDSVIHHGYSPVGVPLYDVLSRILGADDNLLSDLQEQLLDEWDGVDADDDPYYIEETYASSQMTSDWRKMQHSLQFESRLANPMVGHILEKVFGGITQLRSANDQSAIVIAGPGYKLTSFQRARVFQDEGSLAEALKHPEKYLGPVPKGKGTAGRMNAKGISVFYGATDDQTAIAEVRPPVGSMVVTAQFDVVRPLRLLNLNDLSSMRPHRELSYFDPIRKELAERCAFLKYLQSQLLMPVMPDSADSGYLITQAVADFLATHQDLNLDGILFPSVQVPKDALSGQNVILFHKASGVENTEDKYEVDHVSLWEPDEDQWLYLPEIWEAEPKTEGTHARYEPLVPPPDPCLRLDRKRISIHRIQGIRFSTEANPVRFVPWTKDSQYHGFR